MRRIVLGAACLALSATPALAGGLPQQNNATAVGIGSAKSTSVSASKATAISGQGGNGGAVIINPGPAATTNTSTIDNVGHSSVSTVPSVFAPGLAAAGIESCLGSVSGGGSWLGTGVTLGGSIPDLDCSARLDARTLWSFGLKKAAVARLCQTSRIYDAMPEVCGAYLPRPAPVYAPGALPATYAEAPAGTIMLVEGATGRERPCSNYDEGHQRCRKWADAVTLKPKPVVRVASGREIKSAASPSVHKEATGEAEPHPVPLPRPRPAEASHPVSKVTESLGKPVWLQMIHPEALGEHQKEELHDESTRKCLSFCAANGGERG